MIVFSFCEQVPPFKIIDLFVDEYIPFENVYRERIEVSIEGVDIPIISIPHLMQLKMISSRPQDLTDIRQLEVIENNENKNEKKNKR